MQIICTCISNFLAHFLGMRAKLFTHSSLFLFVLASVTKREAFFFVGPNKLAVKPKP
jgi:hypothetical protein